MGTTLQTLSQQTDISVSFLSQIERGISSLSIVSLYSICEALDIPVRQLLVDNRAPSTVTKQKDQMLIRIGDSKATYKYLSGRFQGRMMEAMIASFPPGYSHPLASHEGEEFGYILEGQLTLLVGSERHELDTGDSYHFVATTLHGYKTDSNGKDCKVLWASTQGFIDWHGKD